ncbi:MAG: hypothetical protein CHACPFDD_00547 [Phycisphaerae bacterium]|nr:hypothetical protein [Phycisphaerae bacterium]
MKLGTWLVFVVATAVCWGAYVPTLHQGQLAMGKNSALRAFLCVGIAYFLTAVLIPAACLAAGLEEWKFTPRGVSLATVAGVFGAAGALGIVFAIKSGGQPIYVAPLVFGLAPIVNVFVSMIWHRPSESPSAMFYVGILLAALGAGLVLRFKPA